MKNANYYVWVYASDGSVYSIIPFEKKKDAYKRKELLQRISYSCSVEKELPCEWAEIGICINL